MLRKISLFCSQKGATEVATQFGVLVERFPDCEVELSSVSDEDTPAAMATPSARFLFDDGSEVWLSGHLEDALGVERTLQRFVARREVQHA